MRFNLVDRIVDVVSGKFLRAVKNLTLGEEYLADHFPTFPVMPGVLMLHAVVEASAYLWRAESANVPTVIVLREAKNVKYGTFLAPGHTMEIVTEWVGSAKDGFATFKGRGTVEGASVITAQVTLAGYNLDGRVEHGGELDQQLRQHYRQRMALLRAIVKEQP